MFSDGGCLCSPIWSQSIIPLEPISMDIESPNSNTLPQSPFKTMSPHPIHLKTNLTPILTHSFSSQPLSSASHFTLILTVDRLLLTNSLQTYQQPYYYVPLTFDLKFQVIHQNPKNIKSPKIGFRLYTDQDEEQSFYGLSPVVQKWVKHLGRQLHQKGFHERFKPIRKLGKGNFATVYEVECLQDGRKCAVKAFSKNTCFSTPKGKDGLINQLSIMRTLSKEPHDNLLKLEAVYQSDNSIYVVLELLTGGQLFSRLQERNGLFTAAEVQLCMYLLVSGLAKMHQNRIMHRDLKPENIMLRSTGTFEPVIGDFGLASNVDQEKYLYYRCGTPGYVAPQIVTLTQSSHVEPECDMFSLGVIFHILLVKKPLFQGKKYDEVYKKNKQMAFDLSKQIYTNIDPKAMDLLRKMLAANPNQRISAKLALKHSYFEGVELKGASSPSPTLGSQNKK